MTRYLTISHDIRCPDCDGLGRYPNPAPGRNEIIECSTCVGDGYVTKEERITLKKLKVLLAEEEK